MSPSVLIREAAADGVNLVLSRAGTIKATGDQAAVNRWLPLLREHKLGIVTAAILTAIALGRTSPARARDPPARRRAIGVADLLLAVPAMPSDGRFRIIKNTLEPAF